MPAISAFVGHSFRKEDEDLVSAILNCLDRVRALRSDFSWDHARDPQPTSIDAKVFALFKGKNLFIGICTRAERAVADGLLSRLASWRYAQSSAFQWKASDWILQEIGYALGREMHIILLVEDGTREPGALQGNLERIPLDRSAPEKCFDPLLGMIANLTGMAASASSIADQASHAETVQAPEELPNAVAFWREPAAYWDLTTYSFAFRISTRQKDRAAQEKLREAFAKSALAERDYNRVAWRAYMELALLQSGTGGTIASLETYAKDASENADVAYCLASAYQHFGDSRTSSIWFERASACESDSSMKVHYLQQAVMASLKAGSEALRVAVLEARMRGIGLVDPKATVALLRAEMAIAEERKDDEYAIASMEKFLTLDVSDNDMRFKLAYKYGELSQYEMAMFHYEKIPLANRNGSAWNNLGVAYSNLKLRVKAIHAYRKAAELGETIVMANTAQRFLSAGFLTEGKELLETASAIPDHDRLVDTYFADAKTLADDEDEKARKMLATSKSISDFYEKFGDAFVASFECDVEGDWVSRTGKVAVRVAGENLIATTTVPTNPLSQALAGSIGSPTDATPSARQVEYSGHLRGRAALGTVTRKHGSGLAVRALLGDYAETTVVMWISQDCAAIHLMERSAGGMPSFFSWSRAEAS